MSDRTIGPLAPRLQEVVATRQGWLEREFGYSGIDVTLRLDPEATTVHCSGAVLGWQEKQRLESALRDEMPDGWVLDTGELVQRRTGDWRELPAEPTWLWRERPGAGGPATAASEVLHEDGPVELLTMVGDSALVRTASLLMGWTTTPLGPIVPGPNGQRPSGGKQDAAEAARQFVGVPYRLGGTTQRGMDCSGMVFRAVRLGMGIPAPRHSTDQVDRRRPLELSELSPGDLILLTPPGELAHIGMVDSMGRDGPAIVHASAVRACVVVEPIEDFLGEHEPTAIGAPLGADP